MADAPKPRSASRISDSQVKQLKIALKESANKYDELLEHISAFQREEDRKRKCEIEDVINSELKNTHELCLKLQREIEVIEHKNRQASKSADSSKKNVSAFAADFRLTPEEQDIAYEFKAHVMRKIHSQNQNIKKELELHEKKVDLKKSQQTFKRQVENQAKSQTTLVSLTNVFEKRAIKAESRARRLESHLREADALIARYDNLYLSQGGDPGKIRRLQSVGKHFKPDDVIRKNESLVLENNKLKRENTALKMDNTDLIKAVKNAEAERDETMHTLGTTDMARQELLKRYKKEQTQHKKLQASITQEAAKRIQEKKEIRQVDELDRQTQIGQLSPFAGQERLYQYPVKKNVDKPRQTIIA